MNEVKAEVDLEKVLKRYGLEETTPDKVASKLQGNKWNYTIRRSSVLVDGSQTPIIGLRRDKDGTITDTIYLGPAEKESVYTGLMELIGADFR